MISLLLQEAYVEFLDGSQLFDSMYIEDPEGSKLSQLPGIEDMLKVRICCGSSWVSTLSQILGVWYV